MSVLDNILASLKHDATIRSMLVGAHWTVVCSRHGGMAATLLDHHSIPNDELDPLFAATVRSTEEAIINALFKAETMIGRDRNTRYELHTTKLSRSWRSIGEPWVKQPFFPMRRIWLSLKSISVI